MSWSCSLESIAKTNSNTETDEKMSSFAKGICVSIIFLPQSQRELCE